MTPLDSKIRLTLYIVLALAGSVLSSIDLIDWSEPKEVVKFVIGLIVVAGTTLRSYIDKSPSEVVQPPKTP